MQCHILRLHPRLDPRYTIDTIKAYTSQEQYPYIGVKISYVNQLCGSAITIHCLVTSI